MNFSDSLSVAGHSQGTSALFVYLSSKPDDGKTKVNLCILMSSTIFWGNFFKRWPGYSLIKPIINSGFKIVDYILRYHNEIKLHFKVS